jgi:hypothetical protein
MKANKCQDYHYKVGQKGAKHLFVSSKPPALSGYPYQKSWNVYFARA